MPPFCVNTFEVSAEARPTNIVLGICEQIWNNNMVAWLNVTLIENVEMSHVAEGGMTKRSGESLITHDFNLD